MKATNAVSIEEGEDSMAEGACNDGRPRMARLDVAKEASKTPKASSSDSNVTVDRLVVAMKETRSQIVHFKVREPLARSQAANERS